MESSWTVVKNGDDAPSGYDPRRWFDLPIMIAFERSIIITEIADPGNVESARFVELYSPGGQVRLAILVD